MATLRQRLEHGFGAFGRRVFRHRLLTLAVVLAAAAALVSQLPGLRFDTSTESFFRADDPALIDYNQFRAEFGRDEFIVIAIDPPEVFDLGFLGKLRAFHEALQDEVPHLDEVTSLINARDTRGREDELVVEDLLDELPRTPEAMARLRERVLSSHLYPNLLISEDGRFTTVVIETVAYSQQDEQDLMAGFETGEDLFAEGGPAQAPAGERELLSDAENSEVVAAVRAVMARFEGPDFPLYLAGSPVVTDALKRTMQRDMARFMALAVAAIGAFLLVLFRRFTGVVLPLAVVGLSLVSTIGLMAALDKSLKLPQMILPSFLLAVGVGASVHLLAIFFRRYREGGSKEDAVVYAMEHSGLPIMMTSLTTAAGLLSFSGAAMASVAELGIFAGIGVLIALVNTLAMLPALIALLPIRRRPRFGEKGPDALTDRVLVAVADYATRHAWPVVLGTAAVVALAVAGLPELRFSHNTLVWFPRSHELRQATELIDTELKGSVTVEMVIDTGTENGLYEPAVMNRLDALATYVENYRNAEGERFVGKTNSVVDVLKETHQALNEERPEFYAIPQSRELIAQELLLFENSGSDDLERLVDSQFSTARLSIKVPWDDASAYVTFVSAIQHKGEELFGPGVEVTTTGLLKLFTQSVVKLMTTMAESYAIAIAVITVLMILLIGRFRLGLLSMIPNLSPILLTLGLMGWTGIRLDAFTLLIGGIALGLAVDDTIHFFHNFLRYYGERGVTRAATRDTLLTTGRAMLITTLVLVTGFWLFMFATLNNLFFFGLLTGLTLVLALLADFLLAPAMLELLLERARTRFLGSRAPAPGKAGD